MRQAIREEIFPGGVLLVSRENTVVFFEAYGYANIFTKRLTTRDTIYDLASLTKPLATSLAVMMLILQSKIDLEQNLGSLLPSFKGGEKERITIRDLLCHISGFPDYRPYYEILCRLPINEREDTLHELIVKEPLLYPIGERVLYSDIGFMILRWVIESIAEQRFDHFVREYIFRPLDIDSDDGLFFVDLNSNPREGRFAATEHCPWRNILVEGAVHDENAYVVGGIAGQAGLFGSAEKVYSLLSKLLAIFNGCSTANFFPRDLVQKFFKRHALSQRALGFDAPSLEGSSCGKCFSKRSVGHLGFTGTSFWMDLDSSIIVILLTNRVHPSRNNTEIKAFRPILHDTIMEYLTG